MRRSISVMLTGAPASPLAADFRTIDPRSARVTLLEAGPRLLPAFDELLSEKAKRSLEKLGVETDRVGRVKVAPDLSVPGHSNVFVIGDTAHALDRKGQPLPGVAPVAKQQGAYAARAIEARLAGESPAPFHYRDFGSLATIGRRSAVAQLGRVHLSGYLAWWLWGLAHILVWTDRVDRARELLGAALEEANEQDERTAADASWYLAHVELRAGRWPLARRTRVGRLPRAGRHPAGRAGRPIRARRERHAAAARSRRSAGGGADVAGAARGRADLARRTCRRPGRTRTASSVTRARGARPRADR